MPIGNNAQRALQKYIPCYRTKPAHAGIENVFLSIRRTPLIKNRMKLLSPRLGQRSGLQRLHAHVCRHTFASLMLSRGAKPEVTSEALGHANVAFTLDTYSHIIEGMQSDAMALLDGVLPAGRNGLRQKNNANLTPTHDIMSSSG